MSGEGGLSEDGNKNVVILGRTVCYHEDGLTWEADARHAESAIAVVGIADATSQTASGGPTRHNEADDIPLDPNGQTSYLSVVVRLCNLSADRPEITYRYKERAKKNGRATRSDLTKLKGMGRFLTHTPRAD